MVASSTLQGCDIAVSGKPHDRHVPTEIEPWIISRGGQFHSTITSGTTHLVVSAQNWRDRVSIVQKALEAIKTGQDIKIVNFDWLTHSLQDTKCSESKYLWEHIEKESGFRFRTSVEDENVTDDEDVSLTSVFKKHSESYVDAKELKKAQKKFLVEQDIRNKQMENKKMQEHEMIKRGENHVVAAIFRRNAKKAKNEILSTNHHLYYDCTGFAYDVTLVKVDWKHNRNERFAITIYESNTTPHTYAVNAQFASSGTLPKNEVVGPIGSTFSTAFKVFRDLFKDKTKVDWESRIDFATELEQRENPKRFQNLLPLSKSRFPPELFAPKDFHSANFQYLPPARPPRGFPYDNPPLQYPKAIAQPRQTPVEVEDESDSEGPSQGPFEPLMSGGNGRGDQDLQQSPSVVDNQRLANLDEVAITMEPLPEDPLVNSYDYPFAEADAAFNQNMFEQSCREPDTVGAVHQGQDCALLGTQPVAQDTANCGRISDTQVECSGATTLDQAAEDSGWELAQTITEPMDHMQEYADRADHGLTKPSATGFIVPLKHKIALPGLDDSASKRIRVSHSRISDEISDDSVQNLASLEGQAQQIFDLPTFK